MRVTLKVKVKASKEVRAETLWDGVPIRLRYGRVNQVVATGPFSRSMLFELLANGEIKSIVLKRNGARRGCGLIDLEDLDRFIQAAADQAEVEEVAK